MTKTPFIICLNAVALLLFVGMVLQERTIPQAESPKVELAPQEKIKSKLPKTPVKISSKQMPPAPQKIAQLQAELSSQPIMSVIKKEHAEKEKLELPPPLKAERKNDARVDRVKSLVALQPITVGQSSILSSSKLNPEAVTRAPKKVELEQPELNTVSKPSYETKNLQERMTISAADISKGMAILRETEQGMPLNFEIFWPQNRGQSEKLYNLLSSCYGMQSALLDDQGNLYFPAKKKGRLPSGFSPLLHQVKQAAAFHEAQKLNALRERHSLKETAVSLRVHRRTTHAALLSGLERLSNKPLSEFHSISARYVISGGELAVSDIKFNNVSTSGSIVLGGSSCG